MQFDKAKLGSWIETIDESLPRLFEVVSAARGRGLVLGASVLQIYRDQGWLHRARATGDLDLSIGVITSTQEYDDLRAKLLALGYLASDAERHFRLFSPVKTALSVSYVDLLAHPEGQVSEQETRAAMGVGDGWSFAEIDFAQLSALAMTKNIVAPNPIGFLALKRASFQDDPRRVRDLVDMVDVVFDLVNKALHYELRDQWMAMRTAQPQQASKVRDMLLGIIQERADWDFLIAEQEFTSRGYDIDEVGAKAPEVFREFLEAIDSA